MRLASFASPSLPLGMLILGTLLLSLVAAGSRPSSAESVINKHRATARQKLDALRELAQAEDVCGGKTKLRENEGEPPPPPPPAVPLVFAGDDEPAEKRARVNAIAIQVEHYPRANGQSHHNTFQILPASRLVADAEALLASGTFADGRKPTGAEAQALFDALGRLRYGALLFKTRHSPSSTLEVPRAVLGTKATGSGAKAEVIAPGEVSALFCLVDLETRLPATQLNIFAIGNLGVFPKADKARAAALLADAARFEFFLRLREQLPETTVPCLRTRRAGATIDLCKPDEPVDLPLLRVEPRWCTASPCWQYVDVTGRITLPGPYEVATHFTEGLAMTGSKGQCAIIDRTGKARCQLACKEALTATEGLFPVRAPDDSWRYVDAQCKEVLGPFSSAEPFNGGLASVRSMDDTLALINREGAVTLFTYTYPVWAPSDGLLRVQLHGQKYAFVTQEGAPAFGARRFLAAEDFSEGLAFVEEEGGRKGYLDTAGKLVLTLDAEVSSGGPFRQGLARLNVGTSKTRYIDREGKVVFTLDGHYVGDFSEGLAPLCQGPNGYDCAEGFVDAKGLRVEPPAQGLPGRFSEGLAPFNASARGRPRRGYVDRAFTTVIEPKFLGAQPFSEGLASVEEDGGRWGFIDKSGQMVIPAQYGWASSFSGGLACVEDAEHRSHFFIDPKGQKRFDVPAGWRCRGGFSGGKALLQLDLGFQYLLVDTTGKQQVLLGALWPERVGERRLLVQRDKDKVYGFIDEAGQPVIPFVYSRAETFQEGAALVVDERGALFINPNGKPLTDKRYITAKRFSEGLAPVARGKWVNVRPVGASPSRPPEPLCNCKYAFIDKKGKEVTGYHFGDAEPFSQGLAAVSFGSCRTRPGPEYSDTVAELVACSHKYGYADPSGKLVIFPALDRPEPFEGSVARMDNGRLVDRDGNVLWTR